MCHTKVVILRSRVLPAGLYDLFEGCVCFTYRGEPNLKAVGLSSFVQQVTYICPPNNYERSIAAFIVALIQ